MTRIQSGWVRGSFGQHFEVLPGNGSDDGAVICVRRGKRHDIACGDRVRFTPTGAGQGVIESIETRQSLLWRADHKRQKLLAANIDLVLVVSAGSPSPSLELISRTLVGAEAARIPPWLILTKSDLAEATAQWRPALEYFEELGYPLITLNKHEALALLPRLEGHQSLLVGQSGMGKSTLLNTLIPGARAATQAISIALDGGCHTTTASRAYPMRQGWLMDSPGIQSFGLGYLLADELIAFFPEFSPLQGQCRFPDCRHLQEPECAIKDFVADHPWRSLRLNTLQQLQRECVNPTFPSTPERRHQRRHSRPNDEGAP